MLGYNPDRQMRFLAQFGLADVTWQNMVIILTAVSGLIILALSLVLEYEAILKREIVHLSHDDIESLVDYLCLIATAHQIFYLWRPVLNDPKDDHILELAVKANAAIVTWNTKDFKVAKIKFGLDVLTPKELLIQRRIIK